MDIYFCDICCSRVSDEHLKRGMGVKKADVIVCSTCIEKGLGNELLGAGPAPEPMQVLIEESDVIDLPDDDDTHDAATELDEVESLNVPAEGLDVTEGDEPSLGAEVEDGLAEAGEDEYPEQDAQDEPDLEPESEVDVEIPEGVLEVVDELADADEDASEDEIELEIDDDSSVDEPDMGDTEIAQEVPSTRRKKSSRKRSSTSKSRKRSTTQRKSSASNHKSQRKSSTDKKSASRKQSTRKTAKTKPMRNAKGNKNVMMISAVSISALVLVFVIIMFSMGGGGGSVASPGDPTAFARDIKETNTMAKKGINSSDLNLCQEAMKRIKNMQEHTLPAFETEQRSQGMSDDEMARWLKQKGYNSLIGHTRRALADKIITLE